jgi:hypothetical protein
MLGVRYTLGARYLYEKSKFVNIMNMRCIHLKGMTGK